MGCLIYNKKEVHQITKDEKNITNPTVASNIQRTNIYQKPNLQKPIVP